MPPAGSDDHMRACGQQGALAHQPYQDVNPEALGLLWVNTHSAVRSRTRGTREADSRPDVTFCLNEEEAAVDSSDCCVPRRFHCGSAT